MAATPLLGRTLTLSSDACPLESGETGDIELPSWSYEPIVAHWVRQLQMFDDRDAEEVKKYGGFNEHARRVVFAYEDKFPHVHPTLYTVLPSGITENHGQQLKPKKEKALIAYTYCQPISEETAKDLKKTAFVHEISGGKFNIVQTWPTRFNHTWKRDFDPVPNNPDPENFEEDAVEEFKNAMLKLFELQTLPEETLFYGHKTTENNNPVYDGNGLSLMALLRRNSEVRDELQIIGLIEPNGFVCEYEDPDDKPKKKIKEFYMALHDRYCLYKKEGWQAMACIKPFDQFEKESTFIGGRQSIIRNGTQKTLLNPLTIEWSCEPACRLAGRSALVVWVWGGMIILSRLFSSSPFLDNHMIVGLTVSVPAIFGVCMDFWVMKFCIIAWTQRVKELSIPVIGNVGYHTFLAFMLGSTFVQVSTIQMNALFFVRAWKQSGDVQMYWEYLWDHSSFSSWGCGTWRYMSIARVAAGLGILSVLQLIMPMLSTCWHNTEKQLSQVNVLEKKRLHLAPIFNCIPFRHLHGITRSQELAFLAVAGGLRYTSSMSISYPRAIIEDIVKFKQGFTIKTAAGGLEVMSQGWEMRAIRTFRAVQLTIGQRMFFVLLLKLAFQMNLQIDFFIIHRAKHQKGKSFFWQFFHWDLEVSDIAQVLSILGLLLTAACELIDGWLLMKVFWKLRREVKSGVSKPPRCWLLPYVFHKLRGWCGREKEHALQDHYAYEDLEGQQRNKYTTKDLKAFYYKVCWNMMVMVMLMLISLYLIGYGVLKFIMSARCDSNLWQYAQKCLDEVPENYSCES